MRIAFVLLVSGLLAASCAGGDGGGGGGNYSVEILEVQCAATETNPYYSIGTVTASGTATGDEGSVFSFAISNGGESDATFDCGGWAEEGAGANNTSCRNTAGPETISWSVVQDVYWCNSDCDPSTAENNADKKVKHAFATETDPKNEDHEVRQDVTCP